MSDNDAALRQARAWSAAGRAVALATVVDTWGSSPRPPGSLLAAADDGAFAGSVSGGCIEGAVIAAARQCLASGGSRLLEFGVDDATARGAGLTCGGTMRVLVEPAPPAVDLERLLTARPLLRVMDLEGGGARILTPTAVDDAALPAPLHHAARAALADGHSRRVDTDRGAVFVAAFVPPPRLLVVGGVHIAEALVPMAVAAGFAVWVIEPRDGFGDAARFPGARISRHWPNRGIADLDPDAGTAVVVLAHDPRLDDPALTEALRSPAFYVGALGGGKSQAARRQRLRDAGFGDADLARIHGPVGLDLGGRTAPEIAVAILAEIVAVRHGHAVTTVPYR